MNVETFYDQYWQSGGHVSPELNQKNFLKVFGPLIGLDRLLDYGCGLGYGYQRPLVKSVKNYCGADVSAAALADLKKKGLPGLAIDMDQGTIAAPGNSFDGATCVEVFEHLFDPLQSARELYRVLKPGGVLVATIPNFGYHSWRMMALLRAQVPSEPEDVVNNRFNGVHIRFFSKLMFTRLLRAAGFVDVSTGSFCQSSVWDVFVAAGHFGHITRLAHTYLPGPFHLRFLQDVWPNVFSPRLRAVAYKPRELVANN